MAVLGGVGSINCIKHLQATAIEAGSDLDFYKLFDELTDKVPVISAGAPDRRVLDRGVRERPAARSRVMKQLEPILRTSALTVTGKTVAENTASPKSRRPGDEFGR